MSAWSVPTGGWWVTGQSAGEQHPGSPGGSPAGEPNDVSVVDPDESSPCGPRPLASQRSAVAAAGGGAHHSLRFGDRQGADHTQTKNGRGARPADIAPKIASVELVCDELIDGAPSMR